MRKILSAVLILLCCLLYNQSINAQGKIQASFDYSEGKIFIFYEFQGDKTKNYEIEITLKRTSDPGFVVIPEKLSGDIGEGKFAGRKNKAVWELTPEEEANLEGEDFYFDVTANEISEGGGVPWYWFAGGAAVAGGAAAVLLLGKKDSDGTTPTPPSGVFPTPPVRP